MKYKLENNRLKQQESTIMFSDGSAICNPSDEILISLGYKDVVYNEKPLYDELTQYLTEEYVETDVITVSYIVNEIPVVIPEVIEENPIEESEVTNDGI